MTNYKLKPGILSLGKYIPAKDDEFTGKQELDLTPFQDASLKPWEQAIHYGVITICCDDIEQVERLVSAMNEVLKNER